MAAANASTRGQRTAVLASPVSEFAGWRLAVDCGNAACGGERAYAISALAAMHGGQHTVGALLLRLRCRGCGQGPRSVFIETGPELSARGRLRRLALRGPDDERQDRNF
jgi:hypothetical protein